MAEVLTLIGGLAAIMQLAGSVVKLTKELRVCVRTIRSAPKEIRYFMLETSIFTDQLCYFYEIAKESAAVMNENSKAKRAELIQKILRQCKSVKGGFACLVRRFININGADTTSLGTFWARLLWLWKRPDVLELRLNLQSAIANVTLLCILFAYEESKRKNADSEKLEMLQERLQNWVATARKLRRELAEYKKHNVPETALEDSHDMVKEDSRQLEKHVVQAIRSYTQREVLSTSIRSSRRGPPGQRERKTQEPTALPSFKPTSSQEDTRGNDAFRGHIVPKQTLDEMVGTHNNRALRPNRAFSAADTGYNREEQAPSTAGERQRPLIVPSEQLSERIIGDRVRDDGHGEILEIGDGSVEEVADPNTGSDATAIEIEAPDQVLQPASQSYIEELPRVSEQNSGPEGTELPKINPTEVSEIPHYNSYLDGRSERVDPSIASKSSSATQLEESEASHDSWSDESRGPYIAVAPFGGPRSRKRPRRPRPQSPIG